MNETNLEVCESIASRIWAGTRKKFHHHRDGCHHEPGLGTNLLSYLMTAENHFEELRPS